MPTHCWALNCKTQPRFNHEGRKSGMYCRRHADDSMVNVLSKHCAHAEGCTKQPVFNHAGSHKGAYCRRHAEESTVDVRNRRCAYVGCATQPSWGYWANGKSTFCAKHKGDLEDGLVIYCRRQCKTKRVKGCCKTVKWGVAGEHSTHCDKHGAQNPRFVRVPSRRTGTSAYSSSPGTTMGGPLASGAGKREDEAETTADVESRGPARYHHPVESSHLGHADDV